VPALSYADAPTVEAHGITARPMAVPSRGSTELAIWYLTVPPHSDPQQHSVDREEVFVVRSGVLSGHIDGAAVAAGPGDALLVPPGVEFAVGNSGDEPAVALVCTSAGVTATVQGAPVTPPWSR